MTMFQMDASARKSEVDQVVQNLRRYYAMLSVKKTFYFKENIHDLEFKEYSFPDLVKTVVRLAAREQTNEEFVVLIQRFYASLRDAHASFSVIPSSLPGRAHIAYLGPIVEREGSYAKIVEINPLFQYLPLQKGDLITHINGMPVLDYIDRYMTQTRNLGNKQSNYSFLMNSIFNRDSLRHLMPKDGEEIKVSFLRGTEKLEETLNWIVRDRLDFKADLKEVEAKLKNNEKITSIKITDIKTGKDFRFGLLNSINKLIDLRQYLTEEGYIKLEPKSSFERILKGHDSQLFTRLTMSAEKRDMFGREIPKTRMDILREERNVPENVMLPSKDKYIYPAYIQNVGKQKVGYLRIDTFSPDEGLLMQNGIMEDVNDYAVKELKETLAWFKANGVKKVVVDTINNPGGALHLVAGVTQALSGEKVEQIKMQFGIKESWLKDFYQMSTVVGDEHLRKKYEIIYNELLADQKKGLTLSSKAYPTDIIMPGHPFLKPNADLKNYKFDYVVLANEGNASCGDIFVANIVDNHLGVVAGAQTMGAGGNVVGHDSKSYLNFKQRTTESALVRLNGEYIENNGVKPHIEVKDIYNLIDSKYKEIVDFATDLLSKKNDLYLKMKEKIQAKQTIKSVSLSLSCNKWFKKAKK